MPPVPPEPQLEQSEPQLEQSEPQLEPLVPELQMDHHSEQELPEPELPARDWQALQAPPEPALPELHQTDRRLLALPGPELPAREWQALRAPPERVLPGPELHQTDRRLLAPERVSPVLPELELPAPESSAEFEMSGLGLLALVPWAVPLALVPQDSLSECLQTNRLVEAR